MKTPILITSFFLVQLAQQATSLGTIVNSAFGAHGNSATAWVVLFQASGALFAILLSRLKVFSIYSSRSDSFLAYLVGVGAIGVFLSSSDTAPWYLSIFCRTILSTLLLARLQSSVPFVAPDAIQEVNHRLQAWRALASLIGIGGAPLLLTLISLSSLYLIDGFVCFGIGTLLLLSEKGTKRSHLTHLTTASSPNKAAFSLPPHILSVLGISLGVWIVGGVFQVLEAPILIERFHIGMRGVSMFFLAALVSNLFVIRYFNLSKLKDNSRNTFYCSSALLTLVGAAYLFTPFLSLAAVVVVIMGAVNGVFNLTQSSLLQTVTDHQKRTQAFLWARLVVYVGILAGVGAVILIPSASLSWVLLLFSVGFTFLVVNVGFKEFRIHRLELPVAPRSRLKISSLDH